MVEGAASKFSSHHGIPFCLEWFMYHIIKQNKKRIKWKAVWYNCSTC